MVRHPVSSHCGQRRGRSRWRGRSLVAAVRERVADADGRARPQSVVHVRSVRD